MPRKKPQKTPAQLQAARRKAVEQALATLRAERGERVMREYLQGKERLRETPDRQLSSRAHSANFAFDGTGQLKRGGRSN